MKNLVVDCFFTRFSNMGEPMMPRPIKPRAFGGVDMIVFTMRYSPDQEWIVGYNDSLGHSHPGRVLYVDTYDRHHR